MEGGREEEETNVMKTRKLRAVFIAFGTKGDIFPIAALASEFACDQKQYEVSFITHSTHQNLGPDLATKFVTFVSISSPPVLGFEVDSKINFGLQKKIIEEEHRREIFYEIENIFGNDFNRKGDFIAINFFALEGFHLAELFQVRCIITAPYLVPYSAPPSFENKFQKDFPLLYKYFQDAPFNMVNWNDIIHWMWPLFMETWGSWRNDILKISPIPFTDPVTNLPLWHEHFESPLLLYGFSKDIVERPGYWPPNIHICGFWFLPTEWQFSCEQCKKIFYSNKLNISLNPEINLNLCENHAAIEHFLIGNPNLPIFIGLSSIGSMGFIKNTRAFLMVLKRVIESTGHRFILFSSGYGPLDASISSFTKKNIKSNSSVKSLFNNQLLCFSGSIPYSWIFPKCEVVIHHGGSGSTASALQAGISQIVCPFLMDQFYWAERVHYIGVSPPPIESRHLSLHNEDDISIASSADVIIQAIKLAISPEIKSQASFVQKRVSSVDGIREALKVLREKVVPQGPNCKKTRKV